VAVLRALDGEADGIPAAEAERGDAASHGARSEHGDGFDRIYRHGEVDHNRSEGGRGSKGGRGKTAAIQVERFGGPFGSRL
jgi:hypothetical protein